MTQVSRPNAGRQDNCRTNPPIPQSLIEARRQSAQLIADIEPATPPAIRERIAEAVFQQLMQAPCPVCWRPFAKGAG